MKVRLKGRKVIVNYDSEYVATYNSLDEARFAAHALIKKKPTEDLIFKFGPFVKNG